MKIHLIFILLFMAACINNPIENEITEVCEENTAKEAHISQEECTKLKEYCLRKGFNPDVCILVDFSEYSGNS
ncbi:MAG: hypothetical protein K2L45_09400 [Muribaculaceae bacterium]|nr:hypothetical protein [Muribaculaceae bacterium]